MYSLELTKPPRQIVDKSIAKMIFKPDQCAGFIWPPYQCRFRDLQYSTEVGRQELRVNRYINRNVENLTVEKKAKNRPIPDYSIFFEGENAGLLDEGYMIEGRDRPIYQHVPEFLKKMRQEAEREW